MSNLAEGRIYHGTLDPPGSGKFPYHVQLGYRAVREGDVIILIFCGGTLLTLRYLLKKLNLHYVYIPQIRSFITAAHCGLKRNLTSQTITDKRLEHDQAIHIFAGMYNKLDQENSQQFSRIAVMKYHPGFRNLTTMESLSMLTLKIYGKMNCSP